MKFLTSRVKSNAFAGVLGGIGYLAYKFIGYWAGDMDKEISQLWTDARHINHIFRYLVEDSPAVAALVALFNDLRSPKDKQGQEETAPQPPVAPAQPQIPGPVIDLQSPIPKVVQKGWKFGKRSLRNLEGVNADLVRLTHAVLARSPIDFGITSGVRSYFEQLEHVNNGASSPKTLEHGSYGRHLTGAAIDIICYDENGRATFADFELYRTVGELFVTVGEEMGIPVVWGGIWKSRDGPHIQLDREHYPDPIAWRPQGAPDMELA